MPNIVIEYQHKCKLNFPSKYMNVCECWNFKSFVKSYQEENIIKHQVAYGFTGSKINCLISCA